MLGLLCDIHGNLPALEAVLAEADALGVDSWLLGGDYGIPSPWPLETLERLEALPNATWIRGNGERWARELPDIPEIREAYEEHVLGVIPDDVIDRLYRLPAQVELDGVLYVHGSPLSDVESFAPQPQPDDERMLAGVRDRTVVFGHSHQQFRRPGPNGHRPRESRQRRDAARRRPPTRRGRRGTATSRSVAPSTTSSARSPASGACAASSASSPPAASRSGSD